MSFSPPVEGVPRGVVPTPRTFPGLRKSGDEEDPSVRSFEGKTDLHDVFMLVSPCLGA